MGERGQDWAWARGCALLCPAHNLPEAAPFSRRHIRSPTHAVARRVSVSDSSGLPQDAVTVPGLRGLMEEISVFFGAGACGPRKGRCSRTDPCADRPGHGTLGCTAGKMAGPSPLCKIVTCGPSGCLPSLRLSNLKRARWGLVESDGPRRMPRQEWRALAQENGRRRGTNTERHSPQDQCRSGRTTAEGGSGKGRWAHRAADSRQEAKSAKEPQPEQSKAKPRCNAVFCAVASMWRRSKAPVLAQTQW